jgi:hypothetical protein
MRNDEGKAGFLSVRMKIGSLFQNARGWDIFKNHGCPHQRLHNIRKIARFCCLVQVSIDMFLRYAS